MTLTSHWRGLPPGLPRPWSAPPAGRPAGEPSAPGEGHHPIDPSSGVRQQLFDRRIVLLSGMLDDQAANEVGAALMTLDAIGDDPVHLQVDSGDGSTGAALAVMDIIDLCGVPVRRHRGRLRLFEPPVTVEGNARQLEQLAQGHLDHWAVFCRRIAAASGQSEERVRADATAGRFFSAQEGVDYGLVDEVASPDARVLRLPARPMGFGPP